MKNVFSTFRSKGIAFKLCVASAAMTAAVAAQAELPAWATAMGSEVDTVADDVFALVGPIIGVVLVGFTIIKLIKRGASKI